MHSVAQPEGEPRERQSVRSPHPSDGGHTRPAEPEPLAGVSLADLVRRELAPYATTGNIVVEGPYVGLPAAATRPWRWCCMSLPQMPPNMARFRRRRDGCRCVGMAIELWCAGGTEARMA